MPTILSVFRDSLSRLIVLLYFEEVQSKIFKLGNIHILCTWKRFLLHQIDVYGLQLNTSGEISLFFFSGHGTSKGKIESCITFAQPRNVKHLPDMRYLTVMPGVIQVEIYPCFIPVLSLLGRATHEKVVC